MRFIYLRFLGYLLPLSSLVFALGLASYEWLSYRDSLDALHIEVQSELATASIILAEPTYNQDKNQIRLVIAAIIAHPHIVAARVTDPAGEIIDAFGAANEVDGIWLTTRINFTETGEVMHVGSLAMAYSTESLVAAFQVRVFYTLLLGIGLLSVVILTAWWAYSRTVGIPISRLHSAIGSRLKGNTYEPVKWHSNDELGLVIEEYNEMQKQLQERQETSLSERDKAQRSLAYSNEVLKMTSKMLAENEVDQSVFNKVCRILWQATGSKLVFITEIEQLPGEEQVLEVLGVYWESTKAQRLQFSEQMKNVDVSVPVAGRDDFLEEVYATKKPVISDDLTSDPRSTNEIPGAFPAMREFVMVPLLNTRDEIVGIMGLANKPGGYDDALIEDLAPLLSSVSSLMIACDNIALRQLAESSMLLRQKQLAWQQEVLAELEMQLVNPDIEEEDYLYRLITMRSCRVANLQSASIWELRQDSLQCIIEYDAASNQFAETSSYSDKDIETLRGYLLNNQQRPDGEHKLILPVTIDKNPRGALVFSNVPVDLSADLSIFLSAIGGMVNVLFERKIRGTIEDQLFQSQKMTAVGRLAGGIAHDFNNLLTNIMGYVELAKMDSDGKTERHLEVALENSKRAAELTNQLLTFSRKQVIQPVNLDASATLDSALDMVRSLLRTNVQLEVEQADELPRIRFDKSQFDQVMLNLCINAQDAMEAGGQIRIAASGVRREDDAEIASRGGAAMCYLKVEVRDTGQGIKSGDLPNIFDPFFTTKAEKNSGLGLATVYSLIEQSGGFITVASEVAVGTTFTIYIPEERVEDAAPDSIMLEQTVNTSDSATILVVDDEPAVRQLVANILDSQGHQVFEASDGAEALQVLADKIAQLDLLVTDIVMPGMNGKELAESIAPHHPGVRTLYMSGFVSDAALDEHEQTNLFLQKPFGPKTLIEKVNAVLGDAPQTAQM